MPNLYADILNAWPLFAVVPAAFALLRFDLVAQWLFAPRAGASGEFVAEVWLDHDDLPDAVMYRQRFVDRAAAERHARRYAVLLSFSLPTCDDFSISDGVRPIGPFETQRFATLWTTALPGERRRVCNGEAANR